LTSTRLERCAQSRGEWPGVRRTFLEGLAGMEECVGGSIREEPRDEEPMGDRFGRGERMGGDMSEGLRRGG
jgi:hypothetical protein